MGNPLTFHNHPLKNEITKRWEAKQSNKQIYEWLKAEHPEVTLSVSTLCKHYARFKFNVDRLKSADQNSKIDKPKLQLPLEQILWEVIEQCRVMKKGKNISVKDWQYLDQQMQAAVEKLIRIQEGTGDTRDISVILSEIFAKVEAGEEVDFKNLANKQMSEQEKQKIIVEVDNENTEHKDTDSETS